MPFTDLLTGPLVRVEPFDGLPINAVLWKEAHNQHQAHQRLHSLAVHRPGIVTGLDVIASQSSGQGLVIAPGMGIDADGQVLILAEPLTLPLKEQGQIYITLQYDLVDDEDGSVPLEGGGVAYWRKMEGRKVNVSKELPSGPYLELARITRSGGDKPVRDAKNPFEPDRDEINLLFRRIAFPHCGADVAIGEVGYLPTSSDSRFNADRPNRAGLWNLVREGRNHGFYVEFNGPFRLAGAPAPNVREPGLLYIAGNDGFKMLADAEIERLIGLLTSGTVLLGEAVNNSPEFTHSFQELSSRLGAALRPVGRAHPVLSSHCVFPVPPLGAQKNGALLSSEDGGVLFSSQNYGGAWQGEVKDTDDAVQSRERVRQAGEFGLNVIAWAHQRRTHFELTRLQ